MQREVISLSDFFGGWGKLKMNLVKSSDDDLAKNLLSQMKEREMDLFNNPILNAAIFLDPRYQKFMPNENKDYAIAFLQRLDEKIKSLEKSTDNCDDEEPIDSESVELEEFLSTVYIELNDDQMSSSHSQICIPTEENISMKLKSFIGTSIPMNETVFDYWENNKHAQPELFKLASIIHSVPPTQTTVERAFSAMALILSPLRTNLADKHLENILVVRLNRDIFELSSGFKQ